ncbi:glycosyltransferase family 2 protein [Candidatus Gottesmanbacteria bacterium]|nr:glycosyltransferase family 2 protein [Candidatus Gottesmanbacteria bacterium]
MLDLTIVLPVLNEEDIIENISHKIKKVLDQNNITYELVLVENGSTDKTWDVLKKIAKENTHFRIIRAKRGYGSAVYKGLMVASGKYVCYMPSDGQVDEKIIPILFSEIKERKFDLVKIKRVNRENFIRYIRSKIYNKLARLFLPIDVEDINGSPRIFLRDRLKVLSLTYADSFIDTEFAVKAHYLDWKIKEIPMRNLDRAGGKSTVRIGTVIEFLKNLFWFRWGDEIITWQQKMGLKIYR